MCSVALIRGINGKREEDVRSPSEHVEETTIQVEPVSEPAQSGTGLNVEGFGAAVETTGSCRTSYVDPAPALLRNRNSKATAFIVLAVAPNSV